MAKISELADGGNLLNDDELIVLRAGGNVRATVANLPEVDASGNQSFADNEKAIFGAGSDLQIYHDGSGSYINESGTGNLNINANRFVVGSGAPSYEYMMQAIPNGAVQLYHNNSQKLATTSTGIDVTGSVTADGLTSSGVIKTEGTSLGFVLNETDTTDLNSYMYLQSGTLRFTTTNDAFNSFDTRMSISNSTGDISFYEDTGTTAKFFWDASTERLGIGNSSPQTALDVTGTVTADGLTLGTITSGTPNHTLNVGGELAVLNVNGANPTDAGSFYWKESGTTWGTDMFGARARYDGSSNALKFEWCNLTNTGTSLTLARDTGNVGIGNSSPTTALDVTGTASVSGDLLLGSNGRLQIGSNGTTTSPSIYLDTDTNTGVYFPSVDAMGVVTGGVERLNVGAGGDISFYEDTGTTAKFYWDASTERLQIGDTVQSINNGANGTFNPKLSHIDSGAAQAGIVVGTGSTKNIRVGLFADDTNGVCGISTRFSSGSNPAFVFRDALSGGNERMRIDSSGNVGIGTAAPTYKIDVAGTGRISNGLYFNNASSGGFLYETNAQPLRFGTGNTERMRIDSSGNVGIGTSSPSRKLEVAGQIQSSALWLDNGTNANGGLYRNGDDLELITYAGYGINIMPSNSKVGIGTDSPKTQLDIATGTGSAAGPELTLTNGYAALTTGDRVGAINFYTSDASNRGPNNSAVIEAQAATSLGHDANLVFKTGVPASEGQDAVETMRIDYQGNVGIGTSSPNQALDVDGNVHLASGGGSLLVGASGAAIIDLERPTANYIRANNSGTGQLVVGAGDNLRFCTGQADGDFAQNEAMRIDSSGNVGIGTSSPASQLHLASTASTVTFEDTNSTNNSLNTINSYEGTMIFNVDVNNNSTVAESMRFTMLGDEAMRIDSSGNVGIGTSSISTSKLHVQGTTGTDSAVRVESTAADSDAYYIADNDASVWTWGIDGGNGDAWTLSNAFGLGTPKLTVETGGNLLVGKTGTSFSTDGAELKPDGQVWATKDGGTALSLNRLTSDGSLAGFYKDGLIVGSIGTRAGYLTTGSGDTGLLFNSGEDVIQPESTTGGARDGAIDLGASGARFKDLYLSGGAYLGGTAAANKLDDYEEGTWTPVYEPTTGSFTTMTMAVSHATYTKVGNAVFVTAYIRTDDVDITGGSGGVQISGLPFSASGSHSVQIGYTTSWTNEPLSGYVSGSIIRLQKRTGIQTNTTSTIPSDLTDGTVANANELVFSAYYVTSA